MKQILLILIIILAACSRLLWLDRFPVSLYSDEADQAYNAISLLKTGADEHGSVFPIGLRSFGDWKPPLQTYLMIPFFAAGFPIEFATRLPSAILGIFTILVIYRLTLYWTKGNSRAALLAAFFLTISPWHILQSRSAMLVGITLFFLSTAVLFVEKSIVRPRYLSVAAVCFALSIYGYYAMRMIVPLMLVLLAVRFRSLLRQYPKAVLSAVGVFVTLMIPLGMAFFHEPDVVFGRARTVSVFYDQGVRLRQWELITQDGVDAPASLTNFFHTGIYMFGRNIAGRYLSHLDPRYLFLTGDTVPPFQISGMGIVYLADGLFLLAGSAIAFSMRFREQMKTMGVWLLLSYLPAAFTFLTPASNRTFSAVLPFVVLIALGVNRLRTKMPGRLFSYSLSAAYAVSFFFFLYQYTIVMPQTYPRWWNWGWKQVVQFVGPIAHRYDAVIIFDVDGMPYIYTLLYGAVDPETYQREAVRTYVADRFGYEHVEGYGTYLFPTDRRWSDVKNDPQPRTLYVVPGEMTDSREEALHTIYYSSGMVMAKIFSYE